MKTTAAILSFLLAASSVAADQFLTIQLYPHFEGAADPPVPVCSTQLQADLTAKFDSLWIPQARVFYHNGNIVDLITDFGAGGPGFEVAEPAPSRALAATVIDTTKEAQQKAPSLRLGAPGSGATGEDNKEQRDNRQLQGSLDCDDYCYNNAYCLMQCSICYPCACPPMVGSCEPSDMNRILQLQEETGATSYDELLTVEDIARFGSVMSSMLTSMMNIWDEQQRTSGRLSASELADYQACLGDVGKQSVQAILKVVV